MFRRKPRNTRSIERDLDDDEPNRSNSPHPSQISETQPITINRISSKNSVNSSSSVISSTTTDTRRSQPQQQRKKNDDSSDTPINNVVVKNTQTTKNSYTNEDSASRGSIVRSPASSLPPTQTIMNSSSTSNRHRLQTQTNNGGSNNNTPSRSQISITSGKLIIIGDENNNNGDDDDDTEIESESNTITNNNKRPRRGTLTNSSTTSSNKKNGSNSTNTAEENSPSLKSNSIVEKLEKQQRNLNAIEEFLVETQPLGASSVIQQASNMVKQTTKGRGNKGQSSSFLPSSTLASRGRDPVYLTSTNRSSNTRTGTTVLNSQRSQKVPAEENDDEDIDEDEEENYEDDEEEEDEEALEREFDRRPSKKRKGRARYTKRRLTTSKTTVSPSAGKGKNKRSAPDDTTEDEETIENDDNINPLRRNSIPRDSLQEEIDTVAKYRQVLRKCIQLGIPEVERKSRDEFEPIEDQAILYAINAFQSYENTLEIGYDTRLYSGEENRTVAIGKQNNKTVYGKEREVYISWKRILRENWLVFGPHLRIAMDLKDRWRNMCNQRGSYKNGKLLFGSGYNDSYAPLTSTTSRSPAQATETYLQARSLGMTHDIPSNVLPPSIIELAEKNPATLQYRPVPINAGELNIQIELIKKEIDRMVHLISEYYRNNPQVNDNDSKTYTLKSQEVRSPSVVKGPSQREYELRTQTNIAPLIPPNFSFTNFNGSQRSHLSSTMAPNSASEADPRYSSSSSSSSSSTAILSPVVSQGNINNLERTSLLTIILHSTATQKRTSPITVISSAPARRFFKQNVPLLCKQIIPPSGNVIDLDEVVLRYDSEEQNTRVLEPGARIVRQWLLLRNIDQVTTLFDMFESFWKPYMSPIIIQVDGIYRNEARATNESYERLEQDAERYALAGLFDFQ